MNPLLRDLYLFRGLDEAQLALVDGIALSRTFEPGEEIFRQGSEAKSLYIIQHGAVSIVHELADETRVEVSTLATGSHFGEMAFLDRHPRSATAIAETRSDIVEIAYDDLDGLLDAHLPLAVHFYHALSRFLCSRLRLTTLDLSYEKTRNLSLF